MPSPVRMGCPGHAGRAGLTRRRLLAAAALAPVLPGMSGAPPASAQATQAAELAQPARPVQGGSTLRGPAGSGIRWAPVGLGTWRTFDVAADDWPEKERRREVLRRFFAAGGGMVDSSPMYGRAEALLGELLPTLPGPPGARERLVAATKVWTPLDALGALGASQVEHSFKLWGLPHFDVLLVHNLLNVQGHLKLLRRLKDEGRVGRIGISTSHGRAHDEVMALLRREPLDVLQITYNLADTRAEPVLALAAERGVAVVINRPFDGGALFGRVAGQAVPPWAREAGIEDWPAFFLKWILAHPAITCAIPATRQPAHLDANMAAGRGPLPDAALRRRMLAARAEW